MPRNSWSARGLPLVRRSAAGARAGESSARPADAVAGLPGLVRECLLRLDAFREHTFSYQCTPGGRTGPDVCELVIAGPTSWRSPNADQSAELIAADLTRIEELTSLAT